VRKLKVQIKLIVGVKNLHWLNNLITTYMFLDKR